MSEERSDPTARPAVAEAVVETRGRRPSMVWLIPLVAALVGGFVAWRAFSERGPAITITFKDAEGLEAGKTQVKYKDVEVGIVETVVLAKDLSGVVVHARMVKDADAFLTEGTKYWVVKPRIAGGQVSGLGTLLSGSYIGVDPAREGKHTHEFHGLEVAPIVTTDEPGRTFVLRSDHAGAVEVGAPVFFRQIAVGRVVSSLLGDTDDVVTTRIFVRAPYDQRVHANSRFWNASGIDMSVSAAGLTVDTQSLVSILIGGIAFESPNEIAPVADADAVFPLYENHQDAQKRHYARRVPYLLEFSQSVRGLTVGSPVEFRGIPVGDVTDVTLRFDPDKHQFFIPVRIEIEPERFTEMHFDDAQRRETLEKLVAAGLRAQLKSGNLLTGQLVVALDLHPEAPPATVQWHDDVAQLPTVPTPLEEITANLTRIVERLGKLPVEKIGADLSESLASLRVTLRQSEGIAPALKSTLATTERTVASLGPDSSVNSELRRALLELSDAARALGLAADQIQTQPNSLLFGKEGHQ